MFSKINRLFPTTELGSFDPCVGAMPPSAWLITSDGHLAPSFVWMDAVGGTF